MRIVDSFKNREVIKKITPSALIIYMCSELDEEGKVIKMIAAKDILDIGGVSRASYYRGVKELEKNGLVSGAKAQIDNNAKSQKSTQIEKVSIGNQNDSSIESYQKDKNNNSSKESQIDNSIVIAQNEIETNKINKAQFDNGIEDTQIDNRRESQTETKKSAIDWESLLF